jgi:hypothetical protein
MTFGGVFLDGRSYVDLAGDWLVLATRVMGDMLFGEVPFYEMTRAGSFEIVDFPGGRLGLPGIPEGRYAGRIKIGANLELRSMFLKFRLMGTPVRVGALVFADAGRVWADWKPDPERDGRGVGLKWGVGGGIRIQYGEAVMMRLDAAWSPDAASAGSPVAIYADACHLF